MPSVLVEDEVWEWEREEENPSEVGHAKVESGSDKGGPAGKVVRQRV